MDLLFALHGKRGQDASERSGWIVYTQTAGFKFAGVDGPFAQGARVLEAGIGSRRGATAVFPFAKIWHSCSFNVSQRLNSKWMSKTAWHDNRWKMIRTP